MTAIQEALAKVDKILAPKSNGYYRLHVKHVQIGEPSWLRVPQSTGGKDREGIIPTPKMSEISLREVNTERRDHCRNLRLSSQQK